MSNAAFLERAQQVLNHIREAEARNAIRASRQRSQQLIQERERLYNWAESNLEAFYSRQFEVGEFHYDSGASKVQLGLALDETHAVIIDRTQALLVNFEDLGNEEYKVTEVIERVNFDRIPPQVQGVVLTYNQVIDYLIAVYYTKTGQLS